MVIRDNNKVKNVLDRVSRRMSWLSNPIELHFTEKETNTLTVNDSFEEMNGDWLKGQLRMKTILRNDKEPHLYVCQSDGYVEIMHHYHPYTDEIIDVLDGELIVEIYNMESKTLQSKVLLTKDSGKYIIPANTGHYCYSHDGTLYLIGFEDINENEDVETTLLNAEIKRLTESTDSDHLFIIETMMINNIPIVTDCSSNIENLGLSRKDLIGKNAMSFVHLENPEQLISDIQTKTVIRKIADVMLPSGKIVKVLGFMYDLGGGKINEYLVKL